MNRRFVWAAAVLAAAAALYLLTKTPKTAPAGADPAAGVTLDDTTAETAADDAAIAAASDEGDDNGTASASPAADGPASVERKSLNAMMKTVFDYAQNRRPMDQLVRQLQATGQDPFIARDTNPATGEMIIVRTKNPPPGTRYFHAQYFRDENGRQFPQHMSFEFRAGPTAMADAIAAAKAMGATGTPQRQTADFISWDLPNCNLWIKKMDREDLQDSAINAYSDDDIGTVRVACEINPHPQGEGH